MEINLGNCFKDTVQRDSQDFLEIQTDKNSGNSNLFKLVSISAIANIDKVQRYSQYFLEFQTGIYSGNSN